MVNPFIQLIKLTILLLRTVFISILLKYLLSPNPPYKPMLILHRQHHTPHTTPRLGFFVFSNV